MNLRCPVTCDGDHVHRCTATDAEVMLRRMTLEDVDQATRDGRILSDDLTWYLHEWNTSAFRCTVAYYRDGRIRQRERTDADDRNPLLARKERV